ncbi:MAG: hypothetical protein SFU53_00020 [Terrimicrobiaceae bacterium]|nr:hypothetical protein [Terrimicrobiaceae bacterium]
MFRCGCRSWWAGAAAACNIHRAGRHCPLCTIGAEGFWGVLGVIIAVQTVAAFSKLSLVRRALLALILFPVTGGLISLALGLYKEYWH